MNKKITRRKAISNSLKASVGAIAGLGVISRAHALPLNEKEKTKLPFRISLNASTILAYKLGVEKQIDMVANAGFDGIELWMKDIKEYLENGGKTATLKGKLAKGGLVLENIIGFSQWCSDDAEERKKALQQLREEMNITAQLGGKYIAAPVQGIDVLERAKFSEYSDRYLEILKLGDETGVTPILELWGAGSLYNLADCAHIVISTGHPKATMLLDFYHLYRGGNHWDTLTCINGGRLPVLHMNDYPAEPARESLKDSDRVLPGEGVAPFSDILPKLYDAGFRGGLSVELFNKGYWERMDAETLLKQSYETTYATIVKSLNLKV